MPERRRAGARMPRTLILDPTRELASQVEEAFGKYGVNHKLNLALLIGGVSFGGQHTMRGLDKRGRGTLPSAHRIGRIRSRAAEH
jgi:superfamily II DNA/RNA helicase